ncbi:hypothetical protein Tco_0527387 [Tanacetum coccineum]
MTKQGNFTQRTPQAKKQSDQASRQISKQASGSANTPYDLVFTAMGPPPETTATITSTEGIQRAAFTTPPQTVPGTNTTEPPPPPHRNKGPELGADNLTLEGVATELAPSDFVSQNYETLVALMQEETKKRSSQSLQARLNFELGHHGKQWTGASASVIGSDSRDVHSGLDKGAHEKDEDEDMSVPWRRQKVDAFTRRISDFSEDKKRRMPANVKTYDGTGERAEWKDSVAKNLSRLARGSQPLMRLMKRTKVPSFKEKPPPRQQERLLQKTGNRTSQDDISICSLIAVATTATAGQRGRAWGVRARAWGWRWGRVGGGERGVGGLGGGGWEGGAGAGRGLFSLRALVVGNGKYHPTDNDPKGDIATEGSNFPKPHQLRTLEEQRLVGNGYIIGSPGERTSRKGKINKGAEARKTHLETRMTPSIWCMVEHLPSRINAAGHDIHRMFNDRGSHLQTYTVRTLLPKVRPEEK